MSAMPYDPFIWLHNSQLSFISSFFQTILCYFHKIWNLWRFSCLLSDIFMIYRGILYLVKGGQPCFMIHPFAFMAGWLKLRFNKKGNNIVKKIQIIANNCHNKKIILIIYKKKFIEMLPSYNLPLLAMSTLLNGKDKLVPSMTLNVEGWVGEYQTSYSGNIL